MMDTMTTTEGIPKKLSNPVEVGFTWSRASHPHHSVLFILLEGKSGIKLMNEWNIVVLLEPHKPVQPHLVSHPHNILEVILLNKSIQINGIHWSHFVHLLINVLVDEQLLHTPEMGVLNVQISLLIRIPCLRAA
jgi:hypothetical protein